MKLKSLVAAAVSAVMTLCSVSPCLTSIAESSPEDSTYTLSFNLDYEGFDTEDASAFESVELKAGASYSIPEGWFDTETEYSTGWTYDGFYMFEEGDFFTMPAQDIVFEPVWCSYTDSSTYTVTYDIPEGAIYNPEVFEPVKVRPGRPISPLSASLLLNGYAHVGWLYNDIVLKSSDKIIMPAQNIVFRPRMMQYFDVTYFAGDVDRLTGNSSVVFEQHEGTSFDLADSSRFGRIGFNLVGWTCDVDGLTYKTAEYYTMPGSDVTFTAIWEPKSYVVVFKSNNGKNENIMVNGVTDSPIIAPECTSTKDGYKFAGWDFEGTVYQAGDEFIVPGAKPGLGIALNAVWVEDNGEEETDPVDSITLAQMRQQYIDGEISEEELVAAADFLLGR